MTRCELRFHRLETALRYTQQLRAPIELCGRKSRTARACYYFGRSTMYFWLFCFIFVTRMSVRARSFNWTGIPLTSVFTGICFRKSSPYLSRSNSFNFFYQILKLIVFNHKLNEHFDSKSISFIIIIPYWNALIWLV